MNFVDQKQIDSATVQQGIFSFGGGMKVQTSPTLPLVEPIRRFRSSQVVPVHDPSEINSQSIYQSADKLHKDKSSVEIASKFNRQTSLLLQRQGQSERKLNIKTLSKQTTVENLMRKHEFSKEKGPRLRRMSTFINKIEDGIGGLRFSFKGAEKTRQSFLIRQSSLRLKLKASLDQKKGMYALTKQEIQKYRDSIRREQKTKNVNDESFEQVANDPEKKQSVAKRIFYNHDVTAARGAHAARKATKKLSSTDLTVQTAKAVAQGFQKEVERLNTQFNMQLEELIKEEKAEEERIKIIAEKEEKKKKDQEERKEQQKLSKLRGEPFKLSTMSRQSCKHNFLSNSKQWNRNTSQPNNNLDIIPQQNGQNGQYLLNDSSRMQSSRMQQAGQQHFNSATTPQAAGGNRNQGGQAYSVNGVMYHPKPFRSLFTKVNRLFESYSLTRLAELQARRTQSPMMLQQQTQLNSSRQSQDLGRATTVLRRETPHLTQKNGDVLNNGNTGRNSAMALGRVTPVQKTSRQSIGGLLTPRSEVTQCSSSSKMAGGFRSARELEEHVSKMHHNAGICNRKNSCKSCLKGQRQHNWPESKILRLSNIQPISENSHLIRMTRRKVQQKNNMKNKQTIEEVYEQQASAVKQKQKRQHIIFPKKDCGGSSSTKSKHRLLVPSSNVVRQMQHQTASKRHDHASQKLLTQGGIMANGHNSVGGGYGSGRMTTLGERSSPRNNKLQNSKQNQQRRHLMTQQVPKYQMKANMTTNATNVSQQSQQSARLPVLTGS